MKKILATAFLFFLVITFSAFMASCNKTNTPSQPSNDGGYTAMKKGVTSTPVASAISSQTPVFIPGMPTEVATQIAGGKLNALQQTGFMCLFSSGDGADGGIPVNMIPWPDPCTGATWISNNNRGFSSEAVPTTITFSRSFSVSPELIPNSVFSINFGVDDNSIFVLSNSAHPGGVTIASGGGQGCHGFSFDGSLLDGTGGNNTLTVYVINTISVPVDGNFGYTGVNYQVCALTFPTPTPTPTITPTPGLSVDIFGPASVNAYCSAEGYTDNPNTGSITISSSVSPTGGSFEWSVLGGQLAIVGSSTQPTVVVQGVNGTAPSGSPAIVELKYTLDDLIETDSLSVTVLKPARVVFISNSPVVYQEFPDDKGKCKGVMFETFLTLQLQDQFDNPMPGILVKEDVAITDTSNILKSVLKDVPVDEQDGRTGSGGFIVDHIRFSAPELKKLCGKADRLSFTQTQSLDVGGCKGTDVRTLTPFNITTNFPAALR